MSQNRIAYISPEKNIVITSIDGFSPVLAEKGILNYLKSLKSKTPVYKLECGMRTIKFKYFDTSLRKKVESSEIEISFFFKSNRNYEINANIKKEKIKFNIRELKK